MGDAVSSGNPSPYAVSPVVADAFLGSQSEDVGAILTRARERLSGSKQGYAGNLTPQEAWELISSHAGVLVDVRTAEERQFVGRIPESIHVPWLVGASLQRNPRFVRDLEAKVKRDEVVLLICRSGGRSAAAAQALSEARFRNVFNVLEGFEGELDASQHRGAHDGWRFHHLPWIQD